MAASRSRHPAVSVVRRHARAVTRVIARHADAGWKATRLHRALCRDHLARRPRWTACSKGTTLRGLLLNAYAFWQIGHIALYAAIAAFVGGAIFLVLAILGFLHMRRTPAEADLQPVDVWPAIPTLRKSSPLRQNGFGSA